MPITEREHWEQTKGYTSPVIRWWNGHYITAKQLRDQVIE